jgi:hypothetical protein
MNSQDLLEWVKENTPTGEARGHFAAAILFMFNKELCQAKQFSLCSIKNFAKQTFTHR